jgi:hypothetical protein
MLLLKDYSLKEQDDLDALIREMHAEMCRQWAANPQAPRLPTYR